MNVEFNFVDFNAIFGKMGCAYARFYAYETEEKEEAGMRTFEWGKIKVEIESCGTVFAPWSDGNGKKRNVVGYTVKVMLGGTRTVHETKAYGSIAEYEKWTDALNNKKIGQSRADTLLDYQSIAAMVVDELASAITDPDEFIAMCCGDSKGIAAYDAVHCAQATILAAAWFGEKALTEAAEEIRAKGLV